MINREMENHRCNQNLYESDIFIETIKKKKDKNRCTEMKRKFIVNITLPHKYILLFYIIFIL